MEMNRSKEIYVIFLPKDPEITHTLCRNRKKEYEGKWVGQS